MVVNSGTKFINLNKPEAPWDIDKITNIMIKLKAYCDKHISSKGYTNIRLVEIEDQTWEDPKNNRYDIIIRYDGNKESEIKQQHLFILKDEILDGIAFHKRFKEFYA